MSLAAFHAGLKERLLADAGLAAWLGEPLTPVDGNTPVAKLRNAELPALVFELGDGESEPQVSGRSQDVAADLLLAVAWHEAEPEAAFAQRLALPDLLIRAVMQDHTLGGAVLGAWVSSYESDRNVAHPMHVVRVAVAGEYRLSKS